MGRAVLVLAAVPVLVEFELVAGIVLFDEVVELPVLLVATVASAQEAQVA